MTAKSLKNICLAIALSVPVIAAAQQPAMSPRLKAMKHDFRKVPVMTEDRLVRTSGTMSPRLAQNQIRVVPGTITQDRLDRGVAVISPRTARSFPVVAANAKNLQRQDTLVATTSKD